MKKDTRRYITSNPQLVEMVKNRGNPNARCPCMPSSMSSPFLSPSLGNSNPASMQLANKNSRSYHSATLPAKLKRSPDVHAQRPNDNVDLRASTSERRNSFSGLENELERSGIDPETFLSLYKKEGCMSGNGGIVSSGNREGGDTMNRPPPRSRSQPSGGTDDWFKSDTRVKHGVRQSPHPHPNDSVCFSPVTGASGQRLDLNPISVGRGDHPSAFMRQTSSGTRSCITSPTPNPQSPPPPPPPPPLSQANSNSGSIQESIHSIQSRPIPNHIQAVSPTLPPTDPFSNSLQRGRELKRAQAM